jgi:hypothetical protein
VVPKTWQFLSQSAARGFRIRGTIGGAVPTRRTPGTEPGAPDEGNNELMAVKEVEVRLRVPNMKVRALDENGYPIDHSSMRFRKMIELPAIPKSGEMLELTTSSGRTLPAKVLRSDWHEQKGMFVVACQYANRSITAEEYGALVSDPEWVLKHLLE